MFSPSFVLFDLLARQMSYQHVFFRPVAGSEPTSPNLSQDECEPQPSSALRPGETQQGYSIFVGSLMILMTFEHFELRTAAENC